MNFNKLPKEAPSSNIEPGLNNLTITEARVEVSKKKGSKMLVVTNMVNGNEKFTIDDYYAVYDKDGNDISFGQYKLGRLLEVTNTIPEGNFELNILPLMLKGKQYIANLINEEYNGKDYLKVGKPDDYAPLGASPTNDTPKEEVTPNSFEKQVDSATAENDEDDDI
jgi:hypothetical protein